MSKIIRLEAENFKRLKAVEITPDGNLVVIAGRNGQGKSSVLDAITAALGGTSSKTTPRPIRDGEGKAQIVLETEDLIVTRKFTAAGSALTVKSKDGATYSKGQAKLDDLIGRLSLDPLAFTQLSDKEQLATLLDLVELPFDPAALDADRKALFDQRSEIGRQGKAIGDVAVDESLPRDEQSASQLIEKIRHAERKNDQRGKQIEYCANLADKIDHLGTEIKRLTAEKEAAEKELKEFEPTISNDVIDTHDLEQQLANTEETNAAIRANNTAREQANKKRALRDEYGALTDSINELDKRKAEGLAAATFPVDGLGFDESGVTYRGIPFKQASSAEQLRVSLAMAIALNPALRVIRIADGSLLDSDNLALVQKMAEENDFQVWIEMVHESGDYGVVIEDGEVA